MSSVSNKKEGNKFETEFCELLASHHIWAHNMAQNQAGQPADIIAVRNQKAYLIDCKLISNNSKTFPLSRIEDNQHLSMELWSELGNGEGWFALKYKSSDEIYMIPHISMKALAKEKSVLNYHDVRENGRPFERWVRRC